MILNLMSDKTCFYAFLATGGLPGIGSPLRPLVDRIYCGAYAADSPKASAARQAHLGSANIPLAIDTISACPVLTIA